MGVHSNLFVKNLPKEIDENILRTLFATYGTVVSCRIQRSRFRGANNVGFVKFAKVEEAELAIRYMHSAAVADVVIEVRFADQDVGEGRLRTRSDHGTRRRSGERPTEPYLSRNLQVESFPAYWRERDVMEFFSNFGNVTSVRLSSSRETSGRNKVAYVGMAATEEAAAALRNVDGRIPFGADVPLRVRYTSSDSAGRKGKAPKATVGRESRYAPYPTESTPKRRSSHRRQQEAQLAPVLTQAAIESPNLCPVVGHPYKLEREIPPPDSLSRPPTYTITQSPGYYPSDNHSRRSDYGGSHRTDRRLGSELEDRRTSLYIRNLPREVDELRLYEMFGHYGGVRSVKKLPDRDARSRGGVGFVNYVDHASAAAATAEMDGARVGSHVLIVTMQVHPNASH